EIALLGAVVAAIVALLRRHNAFSVAVRLDQAFPQHLDRWSSSMDLAERIAVAGFAVAVVLLLFVALSPAFDLSLLWHRFIHPCADLPRDSATRIVIVDVNGQAFNGAMPDPFSEGSPLSLRVELHRKPGIFAFGQKNHVIDDADQLAPRLERKTESGSSVTEF